MKRFFKILILLISIFYLTLTGCSNSGGSSDSYTLPEGNHAMLGPLSEATIEICELAYTDNISCINLKTDEYGTFTFNNPSGWDDDKILLVTVSGGNDIDADDNGFLDNTPTVNNGTLHAFAKVSDLENGKVNISILTDMVYNYASNLCNKNKCSLSESDLENILDIISEKLVDVSSTSKTIPTSNTYFGTLINFNPLSPYNTPLKFEYSKIEQLTSFYHKGDDSGIKSILNTDFKDKGLLMNDPAIKNLKKDLKLKIMKPLNGNLIIKKNNSLISDKTLIWFNPEQESDTNFQLTINNLNENYQLIKWIGCNQVSNNGLTCYVEKLENDRNIVPVILPKPQLKDNIIIVDITGVNITFNNISSDNISLNDIESNSQLLDNITVSANNNANLIDNLTNLQPGNIIVHKTTPVFFRKVISIQPNTVNGDTISGSYVINTEFIPITEIIPRGYISTIVTPETLQPETPIQLIDSELIINRSKSIPFDPNKDYLMINLETGKISTKNIRSTNFSWDTNFEQNYGPVYLDKDNNSELSGTLKLRPYADLNIGWDVDVSLSGIDVNLDGLYVTVGADLELLGNATAKLKKTYSLHKIFYDGLEFHQTFTIYGIPIKVKEKIPISYGIKGAGEGKDYDNASLVGNAKINFSGTCNSVFNFFYTGNDYDSNLDTNFNFSQTSELNVGANAFAYIGAEPAIYVYGIGIAMDNYLGPYLKINIKGSQDFSGNGTVSLDEIINDNLTLNTDVSMDGTIGIGYYGRIRAATTWDTDVAKKVINKINDSIRNKYLEYWKEYPLYTIDKEFSSSSEWGITDKPGELQVIGNSFISINADCSDSISKEYQFILKNIGDHPIDWLINNTYDDDNDLNISLSQTSGTLNAGDNTTVTVILSGNIPCSDTMQLINFNLDFRQNSINRQKSSLKVYRCLEKDISNFTLMPIYYNSMVPVETISKYKTNIRVNVIPSISGWTANLQKSEFTRSYQGINLNFLQFNWNLPANSVDGFTIFYSEYCMDNYKFLSDIQGGDIDTYSMISTLNPSVQYCFKIYAYKQQYIPNLNTFIKFYFSEDDSG